MEFSFCEIVLSIFVACKWLDISIGLTNIVSANYVYNINIIPNNHICIIKSYNKKDGKSKPTQNEAANQQVVNNVMSPINEIPSKKLADNILDSYSAMAVLTSAVVMNTENKETSEASSTVVVMDTTKDNSNEVLPSKAQNIALKSTNAILIPPKNLAETSAIRNNLTDVTDVIKVLSTVATNSQKLIASVLPFKNSSYPGKVSF